MTIQYYQITHSPVCPKNDLWHYPSHLIRIGVLKSKPTRGQSRVSSYLHKKNVETVEEVVFTSLCWRSANIEVLEALRLSSWTTSSILPRPFLLALPRYIRFRKLSLDVHNYRPQGTDERFCIIPQQLCEKQNLTRASIKMEAHFKSEFWLNNPFGVRLMYRKNLHRVVWRWSVDGNSSAIRRLSVCIMRVSGSLVLEPDRGVN